MSLLKQLMAEPDVAIGPLIGLLGFVLGLLGHYYDKGMLVYMGLIMSLIGFIIALLVYRRYRRSHAPR